MNREQYVWCIVDRYLSTGLFSYEEAIECARRDVYEVPNNRESLKVLVKHCGLHTAGKMRPKSSSNLTV